jgi:hypothetical protein
MLNPPGADHGRSLHVATAVAIACALAVCACGRPSTGFSEAYARAHVETLAGAIGTRPTGTDANRRAREYVVSTLRSYGFNVRVQETDAARPLSGATIRVANIIAAKQGARAQAVALVSHYDSVPSGPGAADDGLGVAVSLEAARVLAQRPRPEYTLVVLITDAEELGMLGASAVMKDPVTTWIRAVLNFEAVGTTGPSLLFETGEGSGAAIRAWAGAAPFPSGASMMTEIYKRLPNDTDFTLFRRARIPGLNFAPVGNSYAYHTPLDNPSNLDPWTISQTGENTVAIVRALDAVDLSARAPEVTTYFDVLGVKAFAYGTRGALMLLIAALLAGFCAWLTVAPEAGKVAGTGRILLTVVWATAVLAVSAGAMLGVAWVVRAARGLNAPWYAHPDRFFVALGLAGILAGWQVVRLGSMLPRRARGSTHPAVAWAIILPCWIAMAIAAQFLLPSASYLAVVPLLAAGIVLVVLPVSHPVGIRSASAVAAGVAGVFWLPVAHMLLGFVVPVFGRFPIVTPIFVYPAILIACSPFVVPPILALAGQREHHLVPRTAAGPALALAFVLAFAFAWIAPAYTNERPQQRVVRYVSHAGTGEAQWEISGNEATTVVTGDAPIAGGWSAGMIPAGMMVPVERTTSGPFVIHARATVNEPAPVRVAATLTRDTDGATLEITATPLVDGPGVAFVLPPGVSPQETNLAGVMRANVFRAICGPVPPEGVTFRARLDPEDAAKAGATTVIVLVNGVPGAAWPRLPGWLVQRPVVWHARSYFVVPVKLP